MTRSSSKLVNVEDLPTLSLRISALFGKSIEGLCSACAQFKSEEVIQKMYNSLVSSCLL